MSISHYLSITSITERKYLNRYAKRKEYIKEHGEEPPQSLLDDLSDSPDTCFCREIEIVRSGVIQSYFLELLCDKWDSNPKKYKCLQGMFDVNNSYDLLSNFNQFFFFLPKISGFGAVDDVGKRPISLWHKQTPGILGVDFYPDRLYNIL